MYRKILHLLNNALNKQPSSTGSLTPALSRSSVTSGLPRPARSRSRATPTTRWAPRRDTAIPRCRTGPGPGREAALGRPGAPTAPPPPPLRRGSDSPPPDYTLQKHFIFGQSPLKVAAQTPSPLGPRLCPPGLRAPPRCPPAPGLTKRGCGASQRRAPGAERRGRGHSAGPPVPPSRPAPSGRRTALPALTSAKKLSMVPLGSPAERSAGTPPRTMCRARPGATEPPSAASAAAPLHRARARRQPAAFVRPPLRAWRRRRRRKKQQPHNALQPRARGRLVPNRRGRNRGRGGAGAEPRPQRGQRPPERSPRPARGEGWVRSIVRFETQSNGVRQEFLTKLELLERIRTCRLSLCAAGSYL